MTQIYYDGSDINDILSASIDPIIEGFTTNPTLMKAAGVVNYLDFVKELTTKLKNKPISFEVFSDDLSVMKDQARIIASCGDNIYVKIPITNTAGLSTEEVVRDLLRENIKVNITAVFTISQISMIAPVLMNVNTSSIVSIFAGRIADTGIDPTKIVHSAKNMLPNNVKVLWASTREVYNIYEAQRCGADIITVSPGIIKKYLANQHKSLYDYSIETVKMFYNDAKDAGYTL